MRSSLRSPRSKRIRSTPSRLANASTAATSGRVIGAISAEEGIGLPRIWRKKYDAPAPV